ncbi:MAG: putative metal-binding motif-containing protein [Deltaproteobacteria bacterium]|nr:putative metal-binding motif-containing protein [Deltaproteobacteria bacterium]
MKKHILLTLAFLFTCLFAAAQSFAVCIVTDGVDRTGKGFYGDHLSTDSTFRYKSEEINHSNTDGGCSAAGTQDGRVVSDWIAFQTTETTPTGAPVEALVLNPAWGPIEFKPMGNLLVGNYSQGALTDATAEIAYTINPQGTMGYRYNTDGTIRDWGRVVIDARQMPGGLPFECAAGAGDVYLRNLIIYTNGLKKEDLFGDRVFVRSDTVTSPLRTAVASQGRTINTKPAKPSGKYVDTSCLKNGGGIFVCDGDPVLKQGAAENSRDYIDPATASAGTRWCKPRTEKEPPVVVPPCDKKTVYRDADGDGYGTAGVSKEICEDATEAGYVENDDDCNDSTSSIRPGLPEACDGVDNNCNSLIDEGVMSRWYADADGDHHGNPGHSRLRCTAPTGYVANNTDCDDTDPNNFPGNGESCDGADNNCDGLIDEFVTSTWYPDVDGDSFGSPSFAFEGCNPPAGYVANDKDCDDSTSTINPGAQEVCEDGIDQNCDDADTTCAIEDPDGDGFTTAEGDCDPDDATIYPGAQDDCLDGIDQDCDGEDDPCIPPNDPDGDGYTEEAGDCQPENAEVNPGADEVCNDTIDNDCDGAVDTADTECTLPPTHEILCNDKTDNDMDGLVDCEDTEDCADDTICGGGGKDEICTDGADNDGDGLADCDDVADCGGEIICGGPGKPEVCNDALDNDGNGLTDCADVAVCEKDAFCNDLGPELSCDNQFDDDGDGSVDCADPDCNDDNNCTQPPLEIEDCDDGVDNDQDGAVDCADSLCATYVSCNGKGPEAICSDTQDNDTDGGADCADADCLDDPVCANAVETVCGDEADNDGDGYADCDDLDCAGYTIDTAQGTTCADIAPTPSGGAGVVGGGSGDCGCDLTAHRKVTANDLVSAIAGLCLMAVMILFRHGIKRNEV